MVPIPVDETKEEKLKRLQEGELMLQRITEEAEKQVKVKMAEVTRQNEIQKLEMQRQHQEKLDALEKQKAQELQKMEVEQQLEREKMIKQLQEEKDEMARIQNEEKDNLLKNLQEKKAAIQNENALPAEDAEVSCHIHVQFLIFMFFFKSFSCFHFFFPHQWFKTIQEAQPDSPEYEEEEETYKAALKKQRKAEMQNTNLLKSQFECIEKAARVGRKLCEDRLQEINDYQVG